MNGIPIGRLFGVEIRIGLPWVLILAFVAALAVAQMEVDAAQVPLPVRWAIGIVVALGFLGSAVAHDLAHVLIARSHGVVVPAIVVTFFGGAAPSDPAAEQPADEIAIAAAGPLVSLAIGLVLTAIALVLPDGSGLATDGLATLALVLGVLNLVLGAVNLIPAYPLDGGRIVRAIVWRRTGSERTGWAAAARSGTMIGWAAAVGGLVVTLTGDLVNGLMLILCGWFLRLSARAIGQRVQLDRLVDGLSVADVMERGVATVAPGLTVDTFAEQLLAGDRLTAVPVVRGEEILGVVGAGQVRRLRRSAWPTTRVESIMVSPPRLALLSPDQPVATALESLRAAGVDGLPVVGVEGLLGVMTRRAVAIAVHDREVAASAGAGT